MSTLIMLKEIGIMNNLINASIRKQENKNSKLHDIEPELWEAISGGNGCTSSWRETYININGNENFSWDEFD